MRSSMCIAILIGLCATILFGCSRPRVDRPITEHTIRGTYYFLVTETRLEAGLTKLCESHGTANVFPDGRMTICGPTMCNGVSGTPESGSFSYVITGNELSLTEDGASDSTHCKILDGGEMWLCDGSLRTLPELWTWAGTVVKIKTSVDPELLVSEGCLPSE